MMILLYVIAAVLCALAAVVWILVPSVMRRSRPILNGSIRAAGLERDAAIRRDENGVPAIEAATRADAAFATGFIHAQERFFQMDVSRRIGAGELAALFGSKLLPIDRILRVHRFRERALKEVEALDPETRPLLESYVRGVNAGLAALPGRPYEHVLGFNTPEPWRAEDSLLVAYSLYILLQDGRADQKFFLQTLYDHFPREFADFLSATSDSDWDAPLQGGPITPPGIPPPGVFNMQSLKPSASQSPECEPEIKGMINGSNCWVVAGSRTANGRALLANDMHLGFGMPNVFFRLALTYTEDGASRQLAGFTVPGYPLLVTGSNGDVTWGLTNTAADWIDLIRIDSTTKVETIVETLAIKGGKKESLTIRQTEWGPVLRTDSQGRDYAARWVAHQPDAVNLQLRQMERAHSTAEALAAATRVGIPAQNIHIADRHGNIGWTIAGFIPRRAAPSRLPLAPAEADVWGGRLPAQEYPSSYNPASGFLWSANARTTATEDLAKLGWGHYVLGARAHQIRNGLESLTAATEADFLALQLETRAVFLERWRTLLLSILEDDSRSELRSCVQNWSGHARASCAGYRAVRAFRFAMKSLVFAPVVENLKAIEKEFELHEIGDHWEAPLWQLMDQQPAHMVPPGFSNWRDCMLRAADAVAEHLRKGNRPIASHLWGEVNRLTMKHPFTMALPFLGRWLNMPVVPLNGDLNMPLSQLANHGPVQRMIVSPGNEKGGLAHLAGGQTSHPGLPYFGAGHQAWLRGSHLPFLPGPCVYELRLEAKG